MGLYRAKANKLGLRRVILIALAAALLLCLCAFALHRANQAVLEQSAQSVEDTVMRSAMQCYAVEGVYPQSLDYLEEHYGLVINHDRYIVSYDAFSSNLPPQINVLLRGDG